MESTNKNELQNAGKPKNAISYKEAKILQQEYIKNTVKPTVEAFKKIGVNKNEDIRDVTFDLDTLKEYIAYVEKEAAKKGITDGLGLRVYIGAYEKGEVTMFFMPTKKKETNIPSLEPKFEIIENIQGLNRGHAGMPPKDLN